MRFSRILRGWFIPVFGFDTDVVVGLLRRVSSSGPVEPIAGA